MILKENEIQEITNLVNGYSSIHKEFEDIEEVINNLRSKQERFINELEDLRRKETSFNNYLDSKYGKGTLNLETFEYELKK